MLLTLAIPVSILVETFKCSLEVLVPVLHFQLVIGGIHGTVLSLAAAVLALLLRPRRHLLGQLGVVEWIILLRLLLVGVGLRLRRVAVGPVTWDDGMLVRGAQVILGMRLEEAQLIHILL